MATAANNGEKKPFGQVIVRRVAITIALLALMLIPMIALLVITRQPATTYAAMAAMIGILAVLAGSTRLGVITVIVTALLAPIAILAGLTPFTGAVLMGLMALVVGRMSIFGLHRAVLLVPIFMAWLIISPVPWLPLNALDRINALMAKHGTSLADVLDRMHPPAHAETTTGPLKRIVGHALMEQRFDQHYLIWIAVTFLVGGLVPVVVLALAMRRFPLPKAAPTTHTRQEAVPYTITIAVLTAVATYWCLDHPKMTAGAFIIATILVLTQVGGEIKWRLTIERVIGTIVGALVFGLAVQAIGGTSYTEVLGMPFPVGMYGIGLLFGALAILAKFSPRLWIYYVLIVPAAAALNAFSLHEASNFGEQRAVDNVVGAVLVIAAALITLGASRLAGERGSGDPPPMSSGASPA
ncbi:MAG: FUSC family protein [Gaiellales bacterium]